jgi:hypothetical protein
MRAIAKFLQQRIKTSNLGPKDDPSGYIKSIEPAANDQKRQRSQSRTALSGSSVL